MKKIRIVSIRVIRNILMTLLKHIPELCALEEDRNWQHSHRCSQTGAGSHTHTHTCQSSGVSTPHGRCEEHTCCYLINMQMYAAGSDVSVSCFCQLVSTLKQLWSQPVSVGQSGYGKHRFTISTEAPELIMARCHVTGCLLHICSTAATTRV